MRLGKWIVLIAVWVVVTPLLLEGLLRLAVPVLPPSLQLAAERVYKGESLDINRLQLMTTDGDHNFVMRPDIDNALYGPHPSAIFRVSTSTVLNNDRIGFRTAVWGQNVPPDAEFDVAVVGDSFSFCFTEYADCWVTRFAQQTGLNTLNLGQGSTGSMSHWRMIDQIARHYQPPLVIWQWFGNDFNEDYQLAVTRGEMAPIQYGEGIPDYPDESPPLLTWLRRNSIAWVVMETATAGEAAYISDFERFHFTRPYEVRYGDGQVLRFGQRYEQIANNLADPRVSAGVPMSREAFRLAEAAVAAWGGELVFFLIPTREEVYADLTTPIMGAEMIELLGSTRREMNRICDELALTCYDLTDDLQAYARRGEALYYTDDMHLNPRGNAVVEQLVRDWLTELGLVE